MAIDERKGVLVVCGCQSLEKWWSQFCKSEVIEYFEWVLDGEEIPVARILSRIEQYDKHDVEILILSDHLSLERDSHLVTRLRTRGYRVVGAGSMETKFELNKLWAKRFFDNLSINTPLWSLAPPIDSQEFLYKATAGTESKEIWWSYEGANGRGYFEKFVRGVEYSVIVLAAASGGYLLPIVWKGDTQRELVPPYKRLRLCGPGVPEVEQFPGLEASIINLVKSISTPCILEIEFISEAEGSWKVIEVNVRVAGTTRIAAMASRCNFLDLLLQKNATDELIVMPAVCLCAELPISERGAELNVEGVAVTSRLTISGKTKQQIWEALIASEALGWRVDLKARQALAVFVTSCGDAVEWKI